jgi:LAO/AO transport system kinase
MDQDLKQTVDRVLAGDVRTAARLIRDIDDGLVSSRRILKALHTHTGQAYVIGVSGFPGVGKSTLVDKMIQAYRAEGKSLGILTVDPTSPFSGGALLGDRMRMQRHGTDPEVFIRSLATRGQFGGLTRSTGNIIDVLDAMGKEIILVETVGVGQDEVDIVTTAHTTIIVLMPGMGDHIQAIKAGILEVADIFVVNKADLEGVEKTIREIEAMLDMGGEGGKKEGWRPPVVATEALQDQGVDGLLSRIEAHKRFLFGRGKRHLKEHMKKKALRELIETIKEEVVSDLMKDLEASGKLEEMLREIVEKRTDRFTLSERIVAERVKDLKETSHAQSKEG